MDTELRMRIGMEGGGGEAEGRGAGGNGVERVQKLDAFGCFWRCRDAFRGVEMLLEERW